MSKELCNKTKKECGYLNFTNDVLDLMKKHNIKDVITLETTLKEYEGAKAHIEALNKERIENSIKLKALEIIKNELQLRVISQLEGNEIKRYIQYLPYFAKEIDFETFELLKEILK